MEQLGFSQLQLLKGNCHMGVKLLALGGEPDTLVGTDEKLTAQLVLQLFHGTAHIGLAVIQGRGSLGQVPVFCHIIENAVVLVMDSHGIPFLYQFDMDTISTIHFSCFSFQSIIPQESKIKAKQAAVSGMPRKERVKPPGGNTGRTVTGNRLYVYREVWI